MGEDTAKSVLPEDGDLGGLADGDLDVRDGLLSLGWGLMFSFSVVSPLALSSLRATSTI